MLATANVTLQLQGITLTVKALQGRERLSQPFQYTVSTSSEVRLDAQSQVGQPACLVMTDAMGVQRERPGIVTALEETADEVTFTLEPLLATGQQVRNTRLFLYRTRRQLIDQCLIELGYNREQIVWLAQGHEADQRPALLQAGETHLAFISRLLAELGCFFWHAGELENEQICIADNLVQTSFLPPLISLQQAKKAALNGEANPLKRHWSAPEAGKVFALDLHPTEPGKTTAYQRDTNMPLAPGLAARAGQQSQTHAQSMSLQWQLEGTFPTLSVGSSVALPPQWHREPPGPELTVISLTIEGQVYDRAAPETGLRLSVDARLIARACAYQPEFPNPPSLPLMFPAQIESRHAYAEMNEEGRYQLRFGFTERNTEPLEHTDASYPTERMVPFANADQPEATGWHYPLLDRSRILVTLLNNDPNRPCILGFASALDQTGPVINENSHQNRLVTPGGHEWLLDDDPHRIALQTFDGQNLLELDASGENPLINIASQYGLVRFHAGKSMHWTAGESLTQNHGGQKTVSVKQNSIEQTDDQRHLQSAKRQILRAKQNLEQTSDNSQQWHMKTGGLNILAAKDVTLKSQGAQITRISDGSYRVQAPSDITLTGTDGDMLISNGTGGVRLSSDGTIKLFGAQITLKGQSGVTFSGDVEYELGAANEAEAAEALEPEEIDEIEALASEHDSTEIVSGLRWRQVLADVTQPVTLEFAHQHFEPGALATIKIIQMVDGEETTIAEITHELTKDKGVETLNWLPELDVTAEHRFVAEKESLPLKPAQFRFEVDINGTLNPDSNLLRLTRHVTYTATGSAPVRGKVVCYDATLNPTLAELQNNVASIGPIVLGPLFVEITNSTGNPN
ncbi:contractile injection system protein, VgrG/Pvc8 family [Reinekea blandensis]|uniref:Gp5/Type VI secretion system Vgr protein OB-fold domain-containing protein n=1 Tax=Reinekea blandensis MED297 TaxID=314283 RepID=A4BEV0_9GAMM|nr:contractile injection system protein, VgrG/Pvc8 family [Reinekea blandensis]EAR09285.1 hypothetical protein MED297_18393 [Reinekea sp. MED297] [Reinekea blandensis MED297]